MSEGDRWSMPDSGLWIYPDLWWEEVRLDVSSESWGEKGGDEMQPGRLSVQDSEKLGAPGSGGEEEEGSQRSGVVVWNDLVLFEHAALCVTVLSSTEQSVLAFTLKSITPLPGLKAVSLIVWLASAEDSPSPRQIVWFLTNVALLSSLLNLTIQLC